MVFSAKAMRLDSPPEALLVPDPETRPGVKDKDAEVVSLVCGQTWRTDVIYVASCMLALEKVVFILVISCSVGLEVSPARICQFCPKGVGVPYPDWMANDPHGYS